MTPNGAAQRTGSTTKKTESTTNSGEEQPPGEKKVGEPATLVQVPDQTQLAPTTNHVPTLRTTPCGSPDTEPRSDHGLGAGTGGDVTGSRSTTFTTTHTPIHLPYVTITSPEGERRRVYAQGRPPREEGWKYRACMGETKACAHSQSPTFLFCGFRARRFIAYAPVEGVRSQPQEKKSRRLTLGKTLIVVPASVVVPPLALGRAGACTGIDG